ncbi:MAG: hypothetical protein PHV74_13800 [Dehalococcoidia bacterium]|nr:hypothetical protein [Dehalococcoidia bacterium]
MKRMLSLHTDRPEFAGIVLDRKSRQLIFEWFARTEIRNVTYICLLIFRLGWPPVRWVKAFTNNDEPERREE